MRHRWILASLAGLLALLTLTGCSGGSSMLSPGGADEGWTGVYGGQGQVLAFLSDTRCTGALVELTLWESGNGTLTAEVVWEQAFNEDGQCAYKDQCSPASIFNANEGGTCLVPNLSGNAAAGKFSAAAQDGALALSFELTRTGDHIYGRLITDDRSYSGVLDYGEIEFQVKRCESLPCPL